MQDFETLEGSTRRFHLRDNTMTNAAIAQYVGCTFTPDGLRLGLQNCILFKDERPAAIRINEDDVVVFLFFDYVCENLRQIADPVFE